MDSTGDRQASNEHDGFDSSDGRPSPPEPPEPSRSSTPNGIAVASFVLGLVSVPFFWVGLIFGLGPLAIIFGVIGRRNAKRGAPYLGLATWGLGLGIVTSIAGIGLFVALSYQH